MRIIVAYTSNAANYNAAYMSQIVLFFGCGHYYKDSDAANIERFISIQFLKIKCATAVSQQKLRIYNKHTHINIQI